MAKRLMIRIRDVASKQHWHSVDLSREVGISAPTMSRYWNNRGFGVIDLDLLQRFAQALCVPPQSLLVEVEVPDTAETRSAELVV